MSNIGKYNKDKKRHPRRVSYFIGKDRKRNVSEEKIINDKVDELLVKMEKEFKEAVGTHKPLQDELNKEVEKLMKEFDEKEETKRYVRVKDYSDYIALTLSMPLEESTKERIIEEIVGDIEDGGETKEGV